MAAQNFRIKNGLAIGSEVIDSSGDLTWLFTMKEKKSMVR